MRRLTRFWSNHLKAFLLILALLAADLLAQYAGEGDTLLCANGHSLWYLLSDCKIATYSTISTPTFDERLLEYWELYPDRYPSLVIGYEDSEEMDYLCKLLQLDEPLAVQENIVLYRTEGR